MQQAQRGLRYKLQAVVNWPADMSDMSATNMELSNLELLTNLLY